MASVKSILSIESYELFVDLNHTVNVVIPNQIVSMDIEQYKIFLVTIVDSIDLCYCEFLLWLFYPMALTFLLPVVVMVLLYASAMFLHLYKLRHMLVDAAKTGHLYDRARYILAVFWEAHGSFWHGYEVKGMENVPSKGAALLIYYHGTIPVDLYYLMAKLIVNRGRHLRAVGDRFLFKIPGFKLLMEVMGIFPGTISQGNELLNQGHILAIAPGGVREAYFSDHYNLIWSERVGFAKIALQAKVPIIPMFTENCREAFRALGFFKGFFRYIYEKTRLPIVPIYGAFPVKLITHLGEPIAYDPSLSPEQLALKVHQAIDSLISKHQRIPGSFSKALMQRISSPRPCHPTPPRKSSPTLNLNPLPQYMAYSASAETKAIRRKPLSMASGENVDFTFAANLPPTPPPSP